MTESAKASVAMSTVAGSNLGHGRYFFACRPDVCLERKVAIPRLGMADTYGGPNQKFWQKINAHVFKNLRFLPSQYHRLMTLTVEVLTLIIIKKSVYS